jgi:hypothetical protein
MSACPLRCQFWCRLVRSSVRTKPRCRSVRHETREKSTPTRKSVVVMDCQVLCPPPNCNGAIARLVRWSLSRSVPSRANDVQCGHSCGHACNAGMLNMSKCQKRLVDVTGIEPVTPCLQNKIFALRKPSRFSNRPDNKAFSSQSRMCADVSGYVRLIIGSLQKSLQCVAPPAAPKPIEQLGCSSSCEAVEIEREDGIINGKTTTENRDLRTCFDEKWSRPGDATHRTPRIYPQPLLSKLAENWSPTSPE